MDMVEVYVYALLFFVSTVELISGEVSHKQSTLLTKGLANLFWEFSSSNHSSLEQISPECAFSLAVFNNALHDNQEWPLKMLSSSSYYPADLTGTGYADYGDFDRCIKIETVTSGYQVKGQHCTVSFLPTLNGTLLETSPYTRSKIISVDYGLVLQSAICIPSSCTKIDIEHLLKPAFDSIGWQFLKTEQCKSKSTSIEGIVNSNWIQKVCLVALLWIVLINVYLTWYNLNRKQGIDNQAHWIHHISLIQGFRSLVQSPTNKPRNKFLTKVSIGNNLFTILLHSLMWFATVNWGMWGSRALTDHRYKLWPKILPENVVHLMYFYGGLSQSFTLWKVTGSKTPLAHAFRKMLLKMIMISVILVPIVCLMIIMPLLVTGPMNYNISEKASSICSGNILANLFFWQNNIRPLEKICLFHTWSIAVEYQLMPILIVLIYLYKRVPKIAITVNVMILVVSLIYNAIEIFKLNIQANFASRSFDPRGFVTLYEWRTRASSNIWIYLCAPLWTFLCMKYIEKLLNLKRTFKLLTIVAHLLPASWILVSGLDGPEFNLLYWILYTLFGLASFTYLLITGCRELNSFFMHEEEKSESSSPPNNNTNSDESFSDKLLYFATNLLRASYYIHLSVMYFYYNSQRFAIRTSKEFVFSILEMLVYCFLGGFIFHLFVIHPVSIIFDTISRGTKKTKQI